MTISHIIEELNSVPEDKLVEVYDLVHSFAIQNQSQDAMKKKILSYSGSFADLDKDDLKDFLSNLKDTRKTMFNRDVDL